MNLGKFKDLLKDPQESGEEVASLARTQNVSKKQEHKHEWELLSKTQAPATKNISAEALKNFSQADNDLLDRALFGVTVFLWECLVCKELRKEQVLGSDMTQLDEMVDKADKYGPQYIQRVDGTTFVLAKYQPQQNQSVLPMR